MKNITKSWILALTLGIIVAGCNSGGESTEGTTGNLKGAGTTGGDSVTLTGAGSTFVQPAMEKWAAAYKNASINYQGVGSGAGIDQFKAGTVDFAASDMALNDEAAAKLSSPIVQIPVTSGCIAIIYNLPGVEKGLKLSGDVVADIFLGTIKTWNDPRIVAQNPGVKLDATPITVAHRADGSGTTFVFTDYLSTVSPAWKAGPGKGKDVDWPTGVGQPKNAGVAGMVKKTTGGIGYVELAYAMQSNLPYATLKNKAGNYVEPTVDSTAAAINAFADALKGDLRTSVVDTSDPQGYPIAGFTYVLLSKAPADKAKGQAVLDFLTWVLADGQAMAKELHYAPLPQTVADLDKTALAEVQTK